MHSRTSYWTKEIFETIRTIVVAVLLAMVFRSFFFEPFHIPSGSMKGGLLVGDYLFVNKSTYGYSRYSFPFGRFLPEFERIAGHTPARGDVVVFRKPTDVSIDYIKRVIGLPGDRIQVMHGVLFINGVAIKKERVDDFVEYDDSTNTTTRTAQFKETLPEGKSYYVLDTTSTGQADFTPEYIVPEGHYFCMGDNRDNSVDSRYTDLVGYVPYENLIGHAKMIIFSGTEGFSLRTDRFFKWVE